MGRWVPVWAGVALAPCVQQWKIHAMDLTGLPLSRPDITALLARGVQRLLLDHGLSPLLEVPLANGRRADVMALSPSGEIWIVETKSCLADYACDEKWPDYLEFCERFFFAVTEDFPH